MFSHRRESRSSIPFIGYSRKGKNLWASQYTVQITALRIEHGMDSINLISASALVCFSLQSFSGISVRLKSIILKRWFFAPVINYLTSRHHNVHILCMSTGNADGMGSIRKEELYLASVVLKIPTQQVKILDHPDLQDGFGKVWNWNLLASIIDDETRTHSIDVIIAFDDYGISGHCNHCDVHQGVRKLLHDASGRHLEAWEIVSPNIVRKYIGPVDIWLSILFSRLTKDRPSYCLLNLDLRKSYAAMAQHSSQWVWFRKLFVTFSSCTYVTTVKKIVEW
ncbi:probable N-acetylglucosaminyl-phosphatidylinositol de-N-acetylase isoform X3 [Salvia miltiorrhiza]|uniref:probable N-acetylglucosaminyl-phosphatidylinositol de-N-acetylase isoform X3 n=2 Tax=Salvia miltiorrhiza TaxID=226208 RepID=UPI0025AD84B5|nr:probable N-acetylglucosaminyl-phosphatidylinositol de-N-acetylase isoform X3 [Salvia miltiorrhiza]